MLVCPAINRITFVWEEILRSEFHLFDLGIPRLFAHFSCHLAKRCILNLTILCALVVVVVPQPEWRHVDQHAGHFIHGYITSLTQLDDCLHECLEALMQALVKLC